MHFDCQSDISSSKNKMKQNKCSKRTYDFLCFKGRFLKYLHTFAWIYRSQVDNRMYIAFIFGYVCHLKWSKMKRLINFYFKINQNGNIFLYLHCSTEDPFERNPCSFPLHSVSSRPESKIISYNAIHCTSIKCVCFYLIGELNTSHFLWEK